MHQSLWGFFFALAVGTMSQFIKDAWPNAPAWVAPGLFWLSSALCGLCLIMYIIEKRRSAGDGKPVASSHQPALKLALSGGNIFVPDAAKNLTGIALNTSVWNIGAPSAAIAWGIEVVGANGRRASTHAHAIPPKITLRGAPDCEILSESSLIEKTKTPVTKEPITGVLLFYVDMPKDQIEHPAATLEVWVTDIFGARTAVKQGMKSWLLPRGTAA